MKKIVKEGKVLEEILESIKSENNISDKDFLYNKREQKGGLFKSSNIIVEALPLTEIQNYLKDYLNELLTKMDLEVTFESMIREGQIIIKMYSNNNPILIGKNGQTLKALENVCKQIIYNEIETFPYLSLDVEDYKNKQLKRLERLAKNVAREVAKTKIEATLDSMNSYERRIIHNTLTNFRGVYTESIGEEPNRSVVIKPQDN